MTAETRKKTGAELREEFFLAAATGSERGSVFSYCVFCQILTVETYNYSPIKDYHLEHF